MLEVGGRTHMVSEERGMLSPPESGFQSLVQPKQNKLEDDRNAGRRRLPLEFSPSDMRSICRFTSTEMVYKLKSTRVMTTQRVYLLKGSGARRTSDLASITTWPMQRVIDSDGSGRWLSIRIATRRIPSIKTRAGGLRRSCFAPARIS